MPDVKESLDPLEMFWGSRQVSSILGGIENS